MIAPSLFFRSQAGDHDATSELIATHMGIVQFVARRLMRALADDAELDELVSAGSIGLMSAVDNFDVTRGLSFSTFATARVRGAMLDELRRLDRVPRSVRAKARELRRVRDALGSELGRNPTDREIALAAGMPLDRLWQWKSDVASAGAVSLDAPTGRHGEEHLSLGDRLAGNGMDAADRLEEEEAHESLRHAMRELNVAEERVLSLYFFEEMTLHEIALAMSLSESRVSQIRTKALVTLRSRLAPRGVRSACAA